MSIHFISAVPQFSVPDVVLTARYYQQVLGFEVVGLWDGLRVHHDEREPALFGIVQRDQVRLHFNRGDDAHVRARLTENGYDVYFHVAGIDDLAKELRNRGAEILDGPKDRVYGQREIVVRDCNGLVLVVGDDGRRARQDAG